MSIDQHALDALLRKAFEAWTEPHGYARVASYADMLGIERERFATRRGVEVVRFERGIVVERAQSGILQAMLGGLASDYLDRSESARGPDPGRPSTSVFQAPKLLDVQHIFTDTGCLRFAADGRAGFAAGARFTPIPTDPEEWGFDNLRWASGHNAYQSNGNHSSPRDLAELLGWGVRSFELDVFPKAQIEESEVKHLGFHLPWLSRPFGLQDWVSALIEWLGRPWTLQPDVVTLWIELKSDWKTDGPLRFDTFLREQLGARLYGPGQLCERSGAATADWKVPLLTVRAHGWPSRRELRGRVIVVINGRAGAVKQYWNRSHAPAAFIARDGVVDEHLDSYAFGNDPTGARHFFPSWFNGAVTRAWVANSPTNMKLAKESYVNHIASDRVPSRYPDGDSVQDPAELIGPVFDPRSGSLSVARTTERIHPYVHGPGRDAANRPARFTDLVLPFAGAADSPAMPEGSVLPY